MMQNVIDISEHDGDLSQCLQFVKNAGLHVIIRAGFSSADEGREDYCFRDNVALCESLGIPYGLYLYSYAHSAASGSAEASHMIELRQSLGDAPYLVYPLFIDSEEPDTAAYADAACGAYCRDLVQAGYKPGIYASEYWALSNLQSAWNLDGIARWCAKWSVNEPSIPWDMWQTGSGTVAGVERQSFDWNVSRYDVSQAIGQDPMQEVRRLALEVLHGKYGILNERMAKLGDMYRPVQDYINNCYKMAIDVMEGQYGNGQARVLALGPDYEAVQYIVNEHYKEQGGSDA